MTPEQLSAVAAVIQAGAAIIALLITAGLAIVAKRTLDANAAAAKAAQRQAEAADEQAVASQRQVEESAGARRDAEHERLLAAVPLVSATRVHRTSEKVYFVATDDARRPPRRTFFGIDLVNTGPTAALQVRTEIIGLGAQQEPLAGARAFNGAQVPMLGPGQAHTVWIEPTGVYATDTGEVGYQWMELRVGWTGLLGARGRAVLAFSPNDAPDQDTGTPGYGERFQFRSLHVDLDGSGRFPPISVSDS